MLEQKCRSIVPIGLLYVGQREMAATTPDDGKLHLQIFYCSIIN